MGFPGAPSRAHHIWGLDATGVFGSIVDTNTRGRAWRGPSRRGRPRSAAAGGFPTLVSGPGRWTAGSAVDLPRVDGPVQTLPVGGPLEAAAEDAGAAATDGHRSQAPRPADDVGRCPGIARGLSPGSTAVAREPQTPGASGPTHRPSAATSPAGGRGAFCSLRRTPNSPPEGLR